MVTHEIPKGGKMKNEYFARYRLAFFKKRPYRKWMDIISHNRHWQSVGTRRFAFRHTLISKFKYRKTPPFLRERQGSFACFELRKDAKKAAI